MKKAYGDRELLAKMEAELYAPGEGIKLSDFITKEEFEAHPTGELYVAIQLAQKRNNAAYGAKRERERIIALFAEDVCPDCRDNPSLEDGTLTCCGANTVIARIKGEK